MKTENTKMVRKFIVGGSSIALLLILLAIISSIPEIRNTLVGQIVSMTIILRLAILLIIIGVLFYLLFPTSAAISSLLMNFASERDIKTDDKTIGNIKAFSYRVVLFFLIPIIYLVLIYPLRDLSGLAERFHWVPITFVYIILGIVVIVLILLLLSVGPLVESLRKKEEKVN